MDAEYAVEYILEQFENAKKELTDIKETQRFDRVEAEALTGSGAVYVLINPSMKGLLKIGKTKRNAEDRAAEISVGTGVPTEFVVAYEEPFQDSDKAELLIHDKLANFRVSPNREFFRMELKDAIVAIREVADRLEA